jgi:hypothetical protein
MKDLKFIREEFGHNVFFNPNTGENENVKDKTATAVDVFAEAGNVVAYCGEVYTAPMTARSTWREEVFPVKAGALTCGHQYKELVSEPRRTKVRLIY